MEGCLQTIRHGSSPVTTKAGLDFRPGGFAALGRGMSGTEQSLRKAV